ncbi:sugar kinase [Herbidospora galbida]|uniref:Sugar kinase n=1 Tax=Herbidospora galbida TaxID=2575442 RepID=A0A4U3MRC0_9ACTN|nr:FGGY family carbohydrate kinase [Herbidospora galbida]TKK91459.1 sugar kinase [Herbidospora galbida]
MIAGLDVGTSAVKALITDAEGRIVARGQASHPTHRPGPGRVEQDPDDWWRGAAEALAQCGAARNRVKILAVTGQMQDLICPGRPAILYSDTRAVTEHDQALTLLPDEWPLVADNAPDVTSLPGKLLWLRQTQPAVLAAAEVLLMGAAGHLVRRATGIAACDLTTATTTGLLDACRRTWWEPAVTLLGLDGLLPPLVDGHTVTGELRTRDLGLPTGIPVVLAPGDAAATTLGVVGADTGRAYAYLGTSGWLAVVTDRPDRPEATHRLALPRPGHTLLIGAMLNAGSAADWARAAFLPGADPAAADTLAARCGPSGLIALPSLAGERYPVRDPDARGVLIGITPSTTPAQMYRAMLEGVAHVFGALLDALPVAEGPLPVCGGGAASTLWSQIMADVTGRPIIAVDAAFSAAFGAASCGLRAVTGVPLPDLATTSPGTPVEPGPDAPAYAPLHQVHRRLHAALAPTFAALAHSSRGGTPCA